MLIEKILKIIAWLVGLFLGLVMLGMFLWGMDVMDGSHGAVAQFIDKLIGP